MYLSTTLRRAILPIAIASTCAILKADSPEELFRAGVAQLRGTNSATDLSAACNAIAASAVAGHREARLYNGIRYLHGIGTAIDLDEATHWFEKAALDGDHVAMHLAERMHRRPVARATGNLAIEPHETSNPLRAAYWRQIIRTTPGAAEVRPEAHAAFLHRRPSEQSRVTFNDPAFQSLLTRARNGDPEAALHAGLSFQLMPYPGTPIKATIGDPSDPPPPDPGIKETPAESMKAILRLPPEEQAAARVEWRKQAAAYKTYRADFNAWAARNRKTLPAPEIQAFDFIRRAAEQGHASGQLQLAAMFASRHPSTATHTPPLPYCLDRARAGDIEHMYLTGLIFLTAKPVTRESLTNARSWLEQAAAAGHVVAAARLGRELFSGETLSRDLPAAAHHLQLAAREGRSSAARLLASFVPRNTSIQPVPVMAPTTATGDPFRVALITHPQVPAELSSLLHARLSSLPNIALLERDELDQVIREQNLDLTQAGDRLRLGQLLGAQGLALLEPLDTGKDLRLSLRLVSVATGVVFAHAAGPLRPDDPLSWTDKITRHISANLPKLNVSRDQATPISIVRFSTPLNSTTSRETENQLTALLAERLYQVPEVFVLERQRAGLLRREQELDTAERDQFWSGAYLIEGEFNRDGGTLSDIDLELRVTPPGGAKQQTFQGRGTRERLPKLIDDLVGQLAKHLGRNAPADWNPLFESTRYLQEANWSLRWGYYREALAAAEVVIALGNDSLLAERVHLKCLEGIARPTVLEEEEALQITGDALHWFRTHHAQRGNAADLIFNEYGFRLLGNASDLLRRLDRSATARKRFAFELEALRNQCRDTARALTFNATARQLRFHDHLAPRFAGTPSLTSFDDLAKAFARYWYDDPRGGDRYAEQLLQLQPTTTRPSYLDLPPLNFLRDLTTQLALIKPPNTDWESRIRAAQPDESNRKVDILKQHLDMLKTRGEFSIKSFNQLIPNDGYTQKEARLFLPHLTRFGDHYDWPIDVDVLHYLLRTVVDPSIMPKHGHKILKITKNSFEVRRLEIWPRGTMGMVFSTGTPLNQGTNTPAGQARLKRLMEIHKVTEADIPNPATRSGRSTAQVRGTPQQPQATLAQLRPKHLPPLSTIGARPNSSGTAASEFQESAGKPIRASSFWTVPVTKAPARLGKPRYWNHFQLLHTPETWWFAGSLLVYERSDAFRAEPVLVEVPIATLEPVFHDLPEDLHGVIKGGQNPNESQLQLAAGKDRVLLAHGNRLFSKPRSNATAKWSKLPGPLEAGTQLWSACGHALITDSAMIRVLDGDAPRILASTKRRPAENSMDRRTHFGVVAVGADGNGGILFLTPQNLAFRLDASLRNWTEIQTTTGSEARSFGETAFVAGLNHATAWNPETGRFDDRYQESSASPLNVPVSTPSYPVPVSKGSFLELQSRLTISARGDRLTVKNERRSVPSVNGKPAGYANHSEFVVINAATQTKTRHRVTFAIPSTVKTLHGVPLLGGATPNLTWTSHGAVIHVDGLGGFWIVPPEALGHGAPSRTPGFVRNLSAVEAELPAPPPASPPPPAAPGLAVRDIYVPPGVRESAKIFLGEWRGDFLGLGEVRVLVEEPLGGGFLTYTWPDRVTRRPHSSKVNNWLEWPRLSFNYWMFHVSVAETPDKSLILHRNDWAGSCQLTKTTDDDPSQSLSARLPGHWKGTWPNGAPLELTFTHEFRENYRYIFRWKDFPNQPEFRQHTDKARLSELELRPLGTFSPNDHQVNLFPDPKRPDGLLLKGRWMEGKVINGKNYAGSFEIPLTRVSP